MIRTSIVPTLAAAAIAGGSAFITGSAIASRTSSGLDLPDCAGSGVGAVRPSGVTNSSSDPAACWVITAYLLEGAVAAGVEAIVADPTIVVEVTEEVLDALTPVCGDICSQMDYYDFC